MIKNTKTYTYSGSYLFGYLVQVYVACGLGARKSCVVRCLLQFIQLLYCFIACLFFRSLIVSCPDGLCGLSVMKSVKDKRRWDGCVGDDGGC